MADTKITGLAANTSLADGDVFEHVDVSDTSMAGTGTNKYMTAANVWAYMLAKLLAADGAGSGLDADLLDGQSSAYYLAASAYTAADVLTKLLTVDGSGSGLDADLLDGSSSAAFLKLVSGGAAVEDIGAIESNVSTISATGSTETLDTSVFGFFDETMDQACTFTFSNPAPSGKGTTFTMILRGAFTPTFPGSVDWGNAIAPTYTTPALYVFTTVDAGTTWLGAQVGRAFA